MTPSIRGSPFESARTVLERISSLIGRETQPLARSSPSVAGRDMALLAWFPDGRGECTSPVSRAVCGDVTAWLQADGGERLAPPGVFGSRDPRVDVDRGAD